jgi:DNA-binding transcriptional MerR regulator
MKHWKVGELARATGLTVRTLHHYDEIGLLSPSHRTPAGHRLYGEGDLARLQQVVGLRSLGLSLDDVRDCLDRRGLSPGEVIRLQIARLREQIETQRRLIDRLEAVEAGLRSAEGVSAEELIRTIEVVTMHEKYFTPEQMEQIKARGATVGEARIREVEAEWPALIAEARAEMEKGTDPASPRMQELARRWKALVDEFTGGDPGLERSVATMYQQEPAARERVGISNELFAYVGKATEASRRGS